MNNLVGLQFGRFSIEQLLGMGGFSVAYKAFDKERRGNVTIKLLVDRWLTNPDVVRGFVREGQTLSHLDHPNLVKVDEVGELYGQPYQVMTWHEGKTLAQFLADTSHNEITRERVCRILRQIAYGLDYVHQRRMVHRDLKPSNILVLSDESVKILDFGLSVELLGAGFRAPDNAGTGRYMAPEQRRGARPTQQSDIYSFGVILKDCFDSLGITLPRQSAIAVEKALQENARRRPPSAFSVINEICDHLA
jgi:serine/threonine-protein kinase